MRYTIVKAHYGLSAHPPVLPLFPSGAEEVGHDVAMMQYHMTLECSLEGLWGVAFLVIGTQPVMAMKSTPFSLTCVVTLECFS